MMRNALVSGILGGLAGGVLIGILLTVVTPSSPGLPTASLMRLLAAAIGSERLLSAWILALAASAILGAVFGLLAPRTRDSGAVVSVALFFGLVLWVAAGLIGAPLLVGARPGVGVLNLELFPFVVTALMASMLFVSVLAVVFLALRTQRGAANSTAEREFRRAA